MEMNRMSKITKTAAMMKLRDLWDYLCKKTHVNNKEKWRLKCLKIPI